ncbi:MAG TPA: ATP synthase subunit I [Candidatus Butyricicoccus stercorigallinarum]|nr:ATP synthase subunit I [Candidatus Butyricicoccus stercorigallinarum]
MKIEPAVKRESRDIAIGVAVLCVVMVIVFAVIGRFDYTVLLGALLGGGFAILEFFLMALAVQKSVSRDTPEEAKLVMVNSHTRRLLLLAVVVIVGIKAPWFHWVAVVLPLIFPKLIIYGKTLPVFRRKEEK